MNKKIKLWPNGGGFTLIEILVVVAIIAILASVVIIGLGPTQRAGRDARRAADLRQVQTALELYFNRCGYYPGPQLPAPPAPCGAFSVVDWTTMRTNVLGSGLGIAGLPNTDPSGKQYGYAPSSNGTQYVVRAQLDDPSSSLLQNDLDDFGPAGFCTDTPTPWYCIGI